MGSHTIEYHADEGSSEIVFLRNVKVVRVLVREGCQTKAFPLSQTWVGRRSPESRGERKGIEIEGRRSGSSIGGSEAGKL